MKLKLVPIICALIVVPTFAKETFLNGESIQPSLMTNSVKMANGEDIFEDDKCPPCFNCMLPAFECKQFSKCNEFNGQCECIDGFGGQDCSEPLCGGLTNDDSNNDHRPIRKGDSCDCEDGWGGINCNVCQQDSVCDAFMPEGLSGTCYKNGMLVNKFHQMCDVTNKKIVEILNGKKPQVTFSCDKSKNQCNFQFWIAEMESFYCDLSTCDYQFDLNSNSSHYKCKDVACKCVPGRMLCGEKGSIDISDFLTETIQGPGDFSCDLKDKNCKFSEPSMDDLILSVFGDNHITLHCESGECIHYSEIPGYDIPKKPTFTLQNLFTIITVIIGVVALIVASILAIRKSPLFTTGKISLDDSSSTNGNDEDDDEQDDLLNYTPVTLTFENVSYSVGSRSIVNNVSGIVKPGEMLAIMGGSGAGKTTLLDILAQKNKNGTVSGDIKVNGNLVSKNDLKKIIGFVDQEDYLLSTLTVYETVLNSALLRLPRDMSFKAKERKVYEVLKELRILNIKDRTIGSDFERGISGGEKRRVSIACELVTSPSVLFLDEPTSGLDANNASNVIECLVRLTKKYQRTLVFTIHQPRSNIVSLFDKLVLLANGELIYSGDMIQCNEFFYNNGYKCPKGYNIADYLIDITFNEKHRHSRREQFQIPGIDEENADFEDEAEEDIHRPTRSSSNTSDAQREWEHFAVHRDEAGFNKADSQKPHTEPRKKSKIYEIFKNSTNFEMLKNDIETSIAEGDEIVFKGNYKTATFTSQLVILSSRTFKNLYRSPKLLLGSYLLSIFMGFFCGFLYYNIDNDISGFQNRLGLFFFFLSFFGFSTLTGLHSFSIERIIFLKERSNNYYHPLSYYITKIICDVLPLRIFPPIILTSIAYPLIGLNLENNGFIKCLLILVLFNLTVSVEILIIGILVKDSSNATMIGVLTLLFSLLFSGLFINKDSLKFGFLQYLSMFHYGYEALAVNEVKSLILREKKYGLSIEIPGATILSTFGFDVGGLFKDVIFLALWNIFFLILGYLSLYFYVVEQR
ncbi:putative ATP-dependent permease [Wickerhamomyces ciferrii]|uniref:ATP-dependent permease n=1 Tax=Wickerhamomyces ciferrii (strain ATCC 14091 / BCRC 22168 / CBS 111 / JCM 3599 / NBRC 0793 / NRRL Y-1031 F-60-10) TaxID=1206466 RepID=K0KJV3_WICCF|nr:putative ATP-dependent permease [Wickerhamomyces ciferrii]CCH41388.1 putative ATP-dependent permease [Wickerhamomyces ciferrii]